jgi:hypothetical protein
MPDVNRPCIPTERLTPRSANRRYLGSPSNCPRPFTPPWESFPDNCFAIGENGNVMPPAILYRTLDGGRIKEVKR